ncbi:acyl-ACP desaturase [Streptomyces sp. NPDC006285]|uniref:acyl-ACP desaturase n=1 Tax=Streptomyces sp. NPDC006285 TaxID=3364742 RepID=UPI0036BC7E03
MRVRDLTEGGIAEPGILLRELEPVVERLLSRHLEHATDWFPHQYVPWERGRNFDGPLGGEPWEESQSQLSVPVRSALLVGLLTEDNLPSYHHAVAQELGQDGAWGAWLNRWTAEEDRHATAMRAYVHASRCMDPLVLERSRMAQVGRGFTPHHQDDLLANAAYLMVQELGTRVTHRNTGRHSGDPVCDQLLSRIAVDENLHMLFYRDLFAAALERRPDQAMCALAKAITSFRMPGAEMAGFRRLTVQVAVAGIYDQQVHHRDVLLPLLRHLRVWRLPGLSASGEIAREYISQYVQKLGEAGARFDERRSRLRGKPGDPSPALPVP